MSMEPGTLGVWDGAKWVRPADYDGESEELALEDVMTVFVRQRMLDLFLREVAPVLEDKAVRRIAREEIASLCGLVLRRLQEVGTGENDPITPADLASIFGEALNDFTTESKPGT